MSVRTERRLRAGTARIVDSTALATALAEHLLDPARSRPVVVVSTATGQAGPDLEVDAIIAAVGESADVYVLATGSVTLAMSQLLPEKAQVYGGAGRVYPVDRSWQTDPYAAPLRLASGPAQTAAATSWLIVDALGAVSWADRRRRPVDAVQEHIQGEVKALFPPTRAWVQTDDGRNAAVWQDLLRHGLPLERTFRVGMRISGVLDAVEGRIDVSASVRTPGDALASYEIGSVVLCRVAEVDCVAAVVELYPGLRTGISAREVTGNPADRLTSLMSVGEVLTVRVTSRGGHNGRGWRLSAVEEEVCEQPVPAPSFLPDGPPWLVLAHGVPESNSHGMSALPLHVEHVEHVEPVSGVDRSELIEPGEQELLAESSVAVQPLCPTVLLALVPDDPAAPAPVNNVAVPVNNVAAPVDEKEVLRSQVVELDALLLHARALEHAFQFERDGFREHASELDARVQQLDRSVEQARTELRIEKQKSKRLEKQVRSAELAHQRANADAMFGEPD